ncbi:MAG TPA: type IV pilus secretin PilQ, partial [Permianibacter sp.]|nr:type IV pilus secretin PilQ [Permianibacter sp.]
LVQDTPRKLDEVRALIRTLDIPVRQVLIESRVVIANDDFTRELGVRFGLSDKNSQSGFSGTLNGAESMANTGTADLADRLNVNMPVESPAGSIGVNLGRLTDGTILDLELSALEAESRGEVIASPRLMTANQRESFIETGVEIPYLQASSAGNTNVTFRKAVLSLTVKPLITPDDNVILDLTVTKDSLGVDTPRGPAIDTKEVNTQVLARSGETIVLGGVYEEETFNNVRKVPLLGDIPGLGWLFRNKENQNNKQELLIFVTPKIIKDLNVK